MNSGAERFNGLMAMLGIVAGIGAYATTGQVIPGIFWLWLIQQTTNQSWVGFFVSPNADAFIPS